MIIRHVVTRSNVDEYGYVLDPCRARHATVVAGRIDGLAGEIDPRTHLNLDFPDHRLDRCLVVETLERTASVAVDNGQFVFAMVGREHFRRLGAVDVDARRAAWITIHRGRRIRPLQDESSGVSSESPVPGRGGLRPTSRTFHGSEQT